ncbi:MAG: hypothetical protein ACQJCO_07400 [cyanobacterium endosymbiont of Rhopalodia sterrenbergii]
MIVTSRNNFLYVTKVMILIIAIAVMPTCSQVISNGVNLIKIDGLTAVVKNTAVVLETYQK